MARDRKQVISIVWFLIGVATGWGIWAAMFNAKMAALEIRVEKLDDAHKVIASKDRCE